MPEDVQKTMFTTTSYASNGRRIHPVEVVRESESSIWYINSYGKRQIARKNNGYTRYFETWQEAHAFLVDRTRTNIEHAQRQLDAYRKDLDYLEALEPPE